MRLKPPRPEMKLNYIRPIEQTHKNVYYGDEGIIQPTPKNSLILEKVLIILGVVVVYFLFKKWKGEK